jgi:hypothetical protein
MTRDGGTPLSEGAGIVARAPMLPGRYTRQAGDAAADPEQVKYFQGA